MLHQCGKRVKTNSQKVLWANSTVSRSYRGKTGRGDIFTPFLNRVKKSEAVEAVTHNVSSK